MRIPIAFKLITVTVLMLLAATVPIAFKSSKLFEEVSAKREEDANRNQANSRAAELEGLFTSYMDKSKVVASILLQQNLKPEDKKSALDLSFKQDRDFVTLEVWDMKDGKPHVSERLINEGFLTQNNLSKEYIELLRVSKKFPIGNVFAGQIELRNSSTAEGAPLLTLAFPFVKDNLGRITHVALADFRLDRVQKAFSTVSERTVFLVDRDGFAMAHPEDQLAMKSTPLATSPIVEKSMSAKLAEGQLKFTDPFDSKVYIGAYSRTSFGAIVISQAPEEVVLEAARNVRRQAFFITGLVLSAAIFLVFWFSISISTPLERLLGITHEIAKGNFNVFATKQVSSHDEVGELATAFDEMTEGLRERDKMKNVLNKFHGSTVTDDLLSGDLALGGTNKEVTVFFSDIRDFTKFSEGHTPEEVVSMLNEYFQIMVGIINKNHGVVDKFIGDAIMAVWGAPKSSGKDPYFAMKACIEMREALAKLNELRIGRGQVPIKIGIGLHSGRAISGTIGSDERMEYTVIGDTVNMASRIEASTKAFGTDLLVSETTADLGKEEYILEFAGAAEVKGKSEPLKMFKIRGYFDENKNPIHVQTPYSDYEAGHDAKVKMVS